jgi:cyclic pyranopterin phosphate synthase
MPPDRSDSTGHADQPHLSHIDPRGQARMVDVSVKNVTARTAVATARITARPEVVSAILAGDLPKGDVLATARIAGIQAAKRTAELIPLCHPLPLDAVEVDIAPDASGATAGDAIVITARAVATARTGVEMEALTAATVAALTIYDMAKSADKSMTIGPIRLEEKSGGKSGDYRRSG